MSVERLHASRLLIGLLLLIVACAPAPATNVAPTSPPAATQAAPTQTEAPATDVPQPTDTNVPATEAPAAEFIPVLPIGAIADFSASDDIVGIEGVVEVVSERELLIRDFVSLVEEAPGVDIRLGVGDDFSDEVALSLKDITGRLYEGRSVTLLIPDSASGRTFDSIAVFCFDTGELFDFAIFQVP